MIEFFLSIFDVVMDVFTEGRWSREQGRKPAAKEEIVIILQGFKL